MFRTSSVHFWRCDVNVVPFTDLTNSSSIAGRELSLVAWRCSAAVLAAVTSSTAAAALGRCALVLATGPASSSSIGDVSSTWQQPPPLLLLLVHFSCKLRHVLPHLCHHRYLLQTTNTNKMTVIAIDLVSYDFTTRPTQNRSFRRRS